MEQTEHVNISTHIMLCKYLIHFVPDYFINFFPFTAGDFLHDSLIIPFHPYIFFFCELHPRAWFCFLEDQEAGGTAADRFLLLDDMRGD